MSIVENFLYSSFLFQLAFAFYFLSFLFYVGSWVYFLKKSESPFKLVFLRLGHGFFMAGLILNSSLLVLRGIESGRAPFRTLYETLIYAGFTIGVVYLFVLYILKLRILGVLTSFFIALIYGYSLTVRDVEIATIPPSLQTPIMIPHVTSYFFAYAGVSLAFLTALFSLFLPKGISPHWLMMEKQIDLKEYSYSIVKFNFLFLTFGLILGSVWGQIAWSDYWGWDPKENWALISWLSFLVYLHLKKTRDWNGKQLAWVILFAAFAILFTYLGMQYLPEDVQEASLHIYIEDQ